LTGVEPDEGVQGPRKDKERGGGGGDDSTGEEKVAGKASKHSANNKANTAKKNSDGDLSGDQFSLHCVFPAKRESLLKDLQSPILGCVMLIQFFCSYGLGPGMQRRGGHEISSRETRTRFHDKKRAKPNRIVMPRNKPTLVRAAARRNASKLPRAVWASPNPGGPRIVGLCVGCVSERDNITSWENT